jgi:hypothetical protein
MPARVLAILLPALSIQPAFSEWRLPESRAGWRSRKRPTPRKSLGATAVNTIRDEAVHVRPVSRDPAAPGPESGSRCPTQASSPGPLCRTGADRQPDAARHAYRHLGIPALLKHRWAARRTQPFITAGTTLRRTGDREVDLLTIPTFPNFPARRERYTVSAFEPVRVGLTIGAGTSWMLGPLRIEPELRHTHWTAKHWMATTEELQFFLGVALPLGSISR